MKIANLKFSIICVFLLLFVFTTSCEKELEHFDTISYVPCEDSKVTKNHFILSDFECQANMTMTEVEGVRNPAEIQANKSKFVGRYVDGPDAWDALIIDYGQAIDLSTNGLFKMKVRSTVAGTLKVKLEGGTSAAVEKDNALPGDNGWAEYQFNFSDQAEEDHTKLVIFFNAGVASDGSDIYYIDDLFWDKSIDPCDGVTKIDRIINDFECQQNHFIGHPDEETTAPVFDNPDKSGINTTEKVGKYTDNGTDAWDNLQIDLQNPIDLSTNSQLSLKIYSGRTAPILAKLEGGTAVEVWSSIDETNKWVEYTFDFREAADKGNTKVVLFFNGGQTDGTTEDVYYVDDIQFKEWQSPCLGVPKDLSIISDFECQRNYHFGNDPNVSTAKVVANPNKSGVNTSDFVGEYIDNGTDAWDNLFIDMGGEIDLNTNNQLHIKIQAARAVPLLAKLEGGTAVEIWGNIDETGAWKNYSFDFSEAAGQGNTKVVLFFNGGQTDGTATDTYYIDDLRFLPENCDIINEDCSGVEKDTTVVNDFDCQQNLDTVDGIAIVSNPKVSCANRSANVGKFIDDGTNAWDNLLFDFGGAIDLSTHNQLTFRVLSSKSVPVLAKIEGGTAAEIWGNITVVDDWVEYSFDFSASDGANNSKVVLFFNGGQTDGTSEDIYYIDNIRFEQP
ncbi:MAG: hypothetical protein OIF50_09745 [Flavobacteriaceae bacterium]|nr:hypothetical protein [Flavobacteriaceae bacterium]